MVPTSSPEEILAQLSAIGASLAAGKPGAREQLISLSHALIASLELPSEAIQRMGWAEVSKRHGLACFVISLVL